MRSARSKFVSLVMTGALVFTVCGAAGCDASGFFGPNFSVNLIIPTGFGGNPGAYNPFGITQAIVNAFLGAGSTGGTTTTGSGSGSGATPSPVPAANVIGAITN